MWNSHFGIPALYLSTLTSADRRVIRHLALGLCGVMHIVPEDNQLIALLGLGSESSNAQAIEFWIGAQLCERNLNLEPEIFQALAEWLEQEAMALQEWVV